MVEYCGVRAVSPSKTEYWVVRKTRATSQVVKSVADQGRIASDTIDVHNRNV